MMDCYDKKEEAPKGKEMISKKCAQETSTIGESVLKIERRRFSQERLDNNEMNSTRHDSPHDTKKTILQLIDERPDMPKRFEYQNNMNSR